MCEVKVLLSIVSLNGVRKGFRCSRMDLAASSVVSVISSVQMTSSRVRLGQSFKTVGYGCTSCWGCVGAGDVEADVIYITFIGASNT